jgi:transposase
VDSKTFISFLENLIIRFPNNFTLVMDNAQIHKTDASESLLRNMHIPFIYLSPYSPDYSSIELLFNFVKNELKNYFWTEKEMPEIVNEIMNKVTPQQCQGFLKHVKSNWYSDDI